MGLFRKRSTSSTTSTKLKRPLRSGSLPPEVPAIPPPPIQNAVIPQQSLNAKSSFVGPTYLATRDTQRINQNAVGGGASAGSFVGPGPVLAPLNNGNSGGNSGGGGIPTGTNIDDGFSTPVSQVSGLTHPSDAPPARSTAPSSVDAMSAVSSFKKTGPQPYPPPPIQTGGPQMQLNGQRLSTSTMPDDGFYMSNIGRPRRLSGTSAIGSEFDSRPSSMTVTGMSGPAGAGAINTVNRKPPPPPLRDNPSTSTLPQEWTDRDPSINTRFTHSPTPSESASMQSSVVYPQQPPSERRTYYQGGPLPTNNRFRPPPPHSYPSNLPHPPPPHFQNPNGPRRGPPLPGYPPHQYRPNSASQRHPPPPRFFPPQNLTRTGSFRNSQNMLPSLPENRRANTMPSSNSSPLRPNIPPVPGPKHLAITFSPSHIECNTRHQVMMPFKNYHHPVPCTTCRRVAVDGMQYCTHCALRVCRECADRLKKEWNGDVTKGWGNVTSAVEEFRASVGPETTMVAGWSDHSPPVGAKAAVSQLSWPTRSNTERVCGLLGIPYRPKTAPNPTSSSYQNALDIDVPDMIDQNQFNFESNMDLESGASTVSPPSPVTPPAFGGLGGEHRLPLTLPNEHRLPPLAIPPSKHNFEAPGYGYTASPEIVSDSNPELVQPRPQYPVDPANLLNSDSRRSRSYAYAPNPPPPPPPAPATTTLYRTDTQISNTTVGKNSVARPFTGSASVGGRSSIFDTFKSSGGEKKKKGLKGLFSKK
ncbi:hypothetical protein TWF225_002806 [Orbilia oligospora]|nr:hypothetical protein TWF225_002806 [Orbilia oligospora]KAF3253796.1 hypothetical protein TWF128_006411 [Orbilia oligospora]KAF3263834.1 hypothetical protein TWF217_003540 [Orbilia oligospora]